MSERGRIEGNRESKLAYVSRSRSAVSASALRCGGSLSWIGLFVLAGCKLPLSSEGPAMSGAQENAYEAPSPRALPPPPPNVVSIREQLEAWPDWGATVEPEPLVRLDVQASNIPQVEQGARLLEGLAVSGAGAGVLLCELAIDRGRHWDGLSVRSRSGKPDPTAYLTVDGGPELRIRMEENSFGGVFSVPALHLEAGTRLHLRVMDRDPMRDEFVGSVRLAWVGDVARVEARDDWMTVACALLPQAVAESHAEQARLRADRLLGQMEASPFTPDILRDERDRLDEVLKAPRRAIRDAASFIGYPDEVVRALMEREDARFAHYAALRDEALGREADAVSARLQPKEMAELRRGVEVGVNALACEAGRVFTECELTARVRYTRRPSSSASFPDLEMLFDGGLIERCTYDPFSVGTPSLGESLVVYRCGFLPPDVGPARLLRVREGASMMILPMP